MQQKYNKALQNGFDAQFRYELHVVRLWESTAIDLVLRYGTEVWRWHKWQQAHWARVEGESARRWWARIVG